ncbi:hypothetical protein QCA50_000070 [Cerrena zonata]|uniref:Importin N-terminal domain-containing protein n=1 Tax=Cerrena zonata TaxID=2478898 RepID=A0AAW0GVX8_9APHY
MKRNPPAGVPLVHASPEEVFQVITDAASQDPAKIKYSSERLKELLEMTGTYDALSEISVQQTVPLLVRQQAIIQLKNNVTNFWRSRKILTEQRQRIKEHCLFLVGEPDDLIAQCNETIVAKLARYEYPAHWPNVLPDLVNIINNNITARYNGSPSNFIALRRALELVNAILKEGMSQRMLTGVRTVVQIVKQLHPLLQAHYITVANSLASITPETAFQPQATEEIFLAHLIYKCLAKNAAFMYRQRGQEPEFEPWINDFFQSSVLQLKSLSELRINLVLALQGKLESEPIPKRCVATLNRHVYLFGKLFRRLQAPDAPQFIKLPLSDDLVYYYWSKVVQATESPASCIEDSPTAVFPIRFLVQCMVIFKGSVAQWAPDRKGRGQNGQILPRQFVEDAVKLLVTRFIPLNSADMEAWMADPEEWVNAEESEEDHWEYELRQCAERVLMTLASQCEIYVQPLLKRTWDEMRELPAVDLPVIMQKEALYCAIGRCAFPMRHSIPFDEWLQTNLIPEAQGTSTSSPILKRRIGWLLGQWIGHESSKPNNPRLWEILTHLLQDRGPGTDIVVRITAATAIRECVDTLAFELDVFRPFISTIVTELLRLIAEVETSECKGRIANCLNTVIERAELDIVPLMSAIVEPLPQMWFAAGEDWAFKAKLLHIVGNLCKSAKQHSTPLASLVVPMVQDSLSPAAKVQLEEDALEMWQTALRQTTTIESDNGQVGLVELLPVAVELLSQNLDVLGSVVSLVESYLLLDASRVLQTCSSQLFNGFVIGLKNAVSIDQKQMMSVLELLAQLAPPHVYAEAIHQSGLFAFIVKALYDDEAQAGLMTMYIYFLARVAIADKQVFQQLVSLAAPAINMSETLVWEGIMSQWWNRFDNMSEPRYRKLTAMGIASLVSTGRPEVLDRLSSEVCNLWLDVFSEIKEAHERAEEDPSGLTLYWDKPAEDLFVDYEGTAEFDRRKTIYDNDSVRTTRLTQYVGAKINEAEAACGGGAVLQAQWLAKADATVLKQIQDSLTGKY